MDGIDVRVRNIEQLAHTALPELSGYIDTSRSAEIERLLLDQVKAGKRLLFLELSNVDYISSAGWGVFISVIRQMREEDGELQLIGMQPDVHEVYELLEFASILEAWPSLDDALVAVSG